MEKNLHFKHLAAKKLEFPSRENMKTLDSHQTSLQISKFLPRKKSNPLKKPSQQEKDKALQCLSSGKQEGQINLRLMTPKKVRVGPSVALYLPLRLVHPTEPPFLPSQPQVLVINPNEPQGLPSWYRIPPSLYGRRIAIIQIHGRKQDVTLLYLQVDKTVMGL
jgi:hypothetical protein